VRRTGTTALLMMHRRGPNRPARLAG
jgi:hypothetical protein